MTDLIVTEPRPEPPRGALADLRAGAMSAPVEVMQKALAEYKERRETFREWLRAQLVEGQHWGFAPGTEPKYDEAGNILIWNSRKNGGKGGYNAYSTKQWTPKPSLYKAGAEFVVDLMGVRTIYKVNLEAWQQLGSPAETFVFTCELYSRQTGELLGEGHGARKVGTKGGDVNNSIKMAQKSSLVAAVLNTYGLSDLFTQDTEDRGDQPDQNDNPPPDETQPEVAPRDQRMPREQVAPEVKRLLGEWKSRRTEVEGNFENWARFVLSAAKREFNVKSPSQWTEADLKAVGAAIDKDIGL